MVEAPTNSFHWPLWWRITIFVNLLVFITMGNWYAAMISPLLNKLSRFYKKDMDSITHLITYVVLAIGVANIVAVPISQHIGKRYLTILALSLFFACNLWASFNLSFDHLMISRIMGGLGAGIIEAIGPLIVAELFPERQLGSAMVFYVLCLGAGSSFGPFIAGQLDAAGYDFRWNFKIVAIILGVNLLTTILMFPETSNPNLKKPDATSDRASSGDSEKGLETKPGQEIEHTVTDVDHPNHESLMALYIRRSFFLRVPERPERNFFALIIQPWTTLASPAVALTSLLFGVMIAYTVITSIVLPSVLAPPPLRWTPEMVGNLNLSTIVGLIIGIPLGGVVADVLSRRSAARNDGVHVRESRLPAVIPGAIVGPLGVLIIGICLHQKKVWIGLAVGWCLQSVALTAAANVLLTYCVDSYNWRAADIGVVVNTLKNVIAFSVGYGVTPWLKAVGPLNQFGTMAGLLWFFYLLVVPLYLFGARAREASLKFIM